MTSTLPRIAPPTWSAFEITPGGRETALAAGLTYCQVLAAHFPDAVWNVVWRQDPPADTDQH